MKLCLFQVMMYPNKAFTRNGRNTITSRKEPYLKFGQREQLSVGDVRAVNKLYKCQHYLQVRLPVFSRWVYSSDFYLLWGEGVLVFNFSSPGSSIIEIWDGGVDCVCVSLSLPSLLFYKKPVYEKIDPPCPKNRRNQEGSLPKCKKLCIWNKELAIFLGIGLFLVSPSTILPRWDNTRN